MGSTIPCRTFIEFLTIIVVAGLVFAAGTPANNDSNPWNVSTSGNLSLQIGFEYFKRVSRNNSRDDVALNSTYPNVTSIWTEHHPDESCGSAQQDSLASAHPFPRHTRTTCAASCFAMARTSSANKACLAFSFCVHGPGEPMSPDIGTVGDGPRCRSSNNKRKSCLKFVASSNLSLGSAEELVVGTRPGADLLVNVRGCETYAWRYLNIPPLPPTEAPTTTVLTTPSTTIETTILTSTTSTAMSTLSPMMNFQSTIGIHATATTSSDPLVSDTVKQSDGSSSVTEAVSPTTETSSRLESSSVSSLRTIGVTSETTGTTEIGVTSALATNSKDPSSTLPTSTSVQLTSESAGTTSELAGAYTTEAATAIANTSTESGMLSTLALTTIEENSGTGVQSTANPGPPSNPSSIADPGTTSATTQSAHPPSYTSANADASSLALVSNSSADVLTSMVNLINNSSLTAAETTVLPTASLAEGTSTTAVASSDTTVETAKTSLSRESTVSISSEMTVETSSAEQSTSILPTANPTESSISTGAQGVVTVLTTSETTTSSLDSTTTQFGSDTTAATTTLNPSDSSSTPSPAISTSIRESTPTAATSAMLPISTSAPYETMTASNATTTTLLQTSGPTITTATPTAPPSSTVLITTISTKLTTTTRNPNCNASSTSFGSNWTRIIVTNASSALDFYVYSKEATFAQHLDLCRCFPQGPVSGLDILHPLDAIPVCQGLAAAGIPQKTLLWLYNPGSRSYPDPAKAKWYAVGIDNWSDLNTCKIKADADPIKADLARPVCQTPPSTIPQISSGNQSNCSATSYLDWITINITESIQIVVNTDTKTTYQEHLSMCSCYPKKNLTGVDFPTSLDPQLVCDGLRGAGLKGNMYIWMYNVFSRSTPSSGKWYSMGNDKMEEEGKECLLKDDVDPVNNGPYPACQLNPIPQKAMAPVPGDCSLARSFTFDWKAVNASISNATYQLVVYLPSETTFAQHKELCRCYPGRSLGGFDPPTLSNPFPAVCEALRGAGFKHKLRLWLYLPRPGGPAPDPKKLYSIGNDDMANPSKPCEIKDDLKENSLASPVCHLI